MKRICSVSVKTSNPCNIPRRLLSLALCGLLLLSAGCKMNGMNYSTFMHGLKLANVEINRKMLAELAVNDKAAFTQLTELAKAQLG